MQKNKFKLNMMLFAKIKNSASSKTNLFISAQLLFVTTLLYILTFPNLDFSYTDGIDSPLSWVFNYLLEHDFSSTKNILFPHGPLAFFTYPLVSGLFVFFVFDFITKLLFVYFLYMINYKNHKPLHWIFIFTVSYVLFLLSNITYTIIFDIILAFIIAYETNKHIFKYLAFCLIGFGFYIKSYSCVISCIIGASYLIFILVQNKNIKQFALDCLTLLGVIFLLWLLLFHQFSGFINYCEGIFNLAQDNSSAASIYSENNWYILSIGLLAAIMLPLFNLKKQTIFYCSITALAVFASFKHGMARIDSIHVWGFWVFLLSVFLLFIFYVKTKLWLSAILIGTSLSLLYINFTYKGNYFELPQQELIRVNNFTNLISNYNSIVKKAEEDTENKIKYRRISKTLRQTISNSTVDVYPWDYSIIAANKFNWLPRPVIQSYAAYTSWLDKQNADYFNSLEAPEYLIWDFSKGLNSNIDESRMSSIDGRYLLNDEPQTLLAILSNYEFMNHENNLNIYRKRINAFSHQSVFSKPFINQLNEWISVPVINRHAVLRIKTEFKKTIQQRLKSFLYKDEQYWIYIKISDETIHKYRIVPKNAEDGIWINPYVFNPCQNSDSIYVKEVMFKASNQTILDHQIKITFENINFSDRNSALKNVIADFFPISDVKLDSVYYKEIVSFDEVQSVSGIDWDKQKCSKIEGLGKSKSFILNAEAFSPSFEVTLDSVNTIEISSTCWLKTYGANFYNKLAYVFAIEDSVGNVIEWNSWNVTDQILNIGDWNLCTHHLKYNSTLNKLKLKVFLWNTSSDSLYLDDFSVKVRSVK